MKTITPLFFLFFLPLSQLVQAQDSSFKFSVETDRTTFWNLRIHPPEEYKSILYEFQNGHDSLWLKEDFFIHQPKIDFNDNQVWYDEVYLPTYTSWKYFEILGEELKGGYLGTFSFIQQENYSYKTNPSPFEYEAGKADSYLKFNEQLKNEILDERFLPDYLVAGHPQLADKNVISPNSNYKGLSDLGTTSLSGIFLLDTRTMIGARVGYKWILAERWLIEPSLNYLIMWNYYSFPFSPPLSNEDIPIPYLYRISGFVPGGKFANLRLGYCFF